MSKQTIDFGKFVNDKTYTRYFELEQDKFSDDDIADIFVEFTKAQLKEELGEAAYIESWIDEWIHLFPHGVKSGGKLLRSDRKECLKKMINLIKETKYDRDLIFHATRKYLKERAMNDYMYTKCATYFIHKKDEGSELAAQCETYKTDDLTIEKTNMFNEFI